MEFFNALAVTKNPGLLNVPFHNDSDIFTQLVFRPDWRNNTLLTPVKPPADKAEILHKMCSAISKWTKGQGEKPFPIDYLLQACPGTTEEELWDLANTHADFIRYYVKSSYMPVVLEEDIAKFNLVAPILTKHPGIAHLATVFTCETVGNRDFYVKNGIERITNYKYIKGSIYVNIPYTYINMNDSTATVPLCIWHNKNLYDGWDLDSTGAGIYFSVIHEALSTWMIDLNSVNCVLIQGDIYSNIRVDNYQTGGAKGLYKQYNSKLQHFLDTYNKIMNLTRSGCKWNLIY